MKIFTIFLLLIAYTPIYGLSVDLSKYEKSIYSQNGEDGITLKLFELLGTSSKYYVEFGGYDGYLCSNTRCLREHEGWDGLLLDGGYEDLEINLRREFITAENINYLFEKYEVPYNLDLLSIDIDFNDFYVWNALSDKYQPKVVILEYNATHHPSEDKVVLYDPFYMADGTNYFGASILAFYRLGKIKGYSLVYADKMGVNLFFVRDDLINQSSIRFKNVNNVKKLYRKPSYNTGPKGGHPQDPFYRPYTTSSAVLED